jgi:hypothetical protein
MMFGTLIGASWFIMRVLDISRSIDRGQVLRVGLPAYPLFDSESRIFDPMICSTWQNQLYRRLAGQEIIVCTYNINKSLLCLPRQ